MLFLSGLALALSLAPVTSPARAAQFVLPATDVANPGNWSEGVPTTDNDTSLWNEIIDEAGPDDSSTFDKTADMFQGAANKAFVVGLSSTTDPQSSAGHTISVRARKNQTGGVKMKLTITLQREDGSAIAAFTTPALDATWTEYTYTLTTAEADSISSTDYSSLQIKVDADPSAGTTNEGRHPEVTELELELPSSPPESPLPGVLDYAVYTQQQIVGSFSYGSSSAIFASELATPSRAILHLAVNGTQLDATLDAESQTATWTGHDQALFIEEHEALVALSYHLDGTLGQQETLLPHEHLLYRGVLLWSDAPIGLPLTLQHVDPPVVGPDDSEASLEPGVPVYDDCKDAPAPTALVAMTAGTTAASSQTCQRPDDDGIVYFNNCSRSANADLYHDARNAHCFLVQRDRRVGPCTKKCKGKCGPGCGGGPRRFRDPFTRDCAEHDQCCAIHGGCFYPRDSQCGDEFFDADDDFLFAKGTCAFCAS